MNGRGGEKITGRNAQAWLCMLTLSPAELYLWGAEANVEFSNCDMGGLRVIFAVVSGPNRKRP